MFSGMTIDELQVRLNEVNAQRDALSVDAKRIAREIEIKRAEEKIRQMPEAERDVLLQTLHAQGVSSGEVFGKV